jgi:imidazolonepropionase-like amidohydrolase
MKILLVIASLLLTACTRPRAPTVGAYDARPGAPTVAMRAVTVVNVMDGSLLPEQTVLIAGNRIVAVGTTDKVRIPRDAELVEAAHRYLIPGLWDMHVHSVGPVAADTANPSIAAQDWHLPLFLAYGVTGVRNMNDGTGDVTLELTNTIKRQLAEGTRCGPPRFLSAGPAVDGDPYMGMNKKVAVRTAAEARAVVEQLASNGADLIKVYENVSRETYFAIIDEAKRREIPVDGHLPFRITPEEAAVAGQRTVEHPEALAAGCSIEADAERRRFAGALADYDGLPGSENLLLMQIRHYRALYDSRDSAACASAFETYRRSGVAVTADLLVYHHIVHAEQILSDTARMRLVPETIRRNWENLLKSETTRALQSILRPIPPLELQNVRLANEAGVVLLAATDVDIPMGVPGLSLHEELVRLVEAGLTPLAALQTATRNPARVLGLADSLGRIEPGKLADLVLLDANPLEDIRNTQKIRAVVADGQLYRRADLDRLLAEVAALNQRVGGRGRGRHNTLLHLTVRCAARR